MRRIIWVCLIIIILLGCYEPNENDCDTGEMKCNNNIVWICNSERGWDKVQNCAENELVCCELTDIEGDELALCLDACEE